MWSAHHRNLITSRIKNKHKFKTKIEWNETQNKNKSYKQIERWWAAEWAEHVTCVHIRLKLHTVCARHAESEINSNGSLRTRATLHIQRWGDTKEGRPTVVFVNSSHIRCHFCVLVSTNVLNGLEFTLRSKTNTSFDMKCKTQKERRERERRQTLNEYTHAHTRHTKPQRIVFFEMKNEKKKNAYAVACVALHNNNKWRIECKRCLRSTLFTQNTHSMNRSRCRYCCRSVERVCVGWWLIQWLILHIDSIIGTATTSTTVAASCVCKCVILYARDRWIQWSE